jgi:uroporphyrinogen-III decarboxylase
MRGQGRKRPVVPYVGAFAGTLFGKTLQELYERPAALAQALQSACSLFGYDAITCVYDPTLLPEACGCTVEWRDGKPAITGDIRSGLSELDTAEVAKRGRLAKTVEAASVLHQLVGDEVAIVGVVSGPNRLAANLMGAAVTERSPSGDEAAKEAIHKATESVVAAARAFCETANVAGLLLLERGLEPTAGDMPSKALLSAYRTIHNLASFYDVPLIVQHDETSTALAETLLRLPVEAVSLGASASPAVPDTRETTALGVDIMRPGSGATPERPGVSYFWDTGSEVAADTSPDLLHERIKAA